MNRVKKKKRIICFTASCGGHLEELSKLSELVGKNDFLFTEKSVNNNIEWCNDVVFVSQINRKERFFVFKFIWLFMKSGYILLKKKPDIIISTGALVTYPICLLGKILGKKKPSSSSGKRYRLNTAKLMSTEFSISSTLMSMANKLRRVKKP